MKPLQMSHDVIVATARSQIAAHTIIKNLWPLYFKREEDAAKSWLNYKARHPRATLEQWFVEFDSTILLPKEDIAQACTSIAAHKTVGENWVIYFRTQEEAARSWLRYKSKYPRTTLEEWLKQCKPIRTVNDPAWAI